MAGTKSKSQSDKVLAKIDRLVKKFKSNSRIGFGEFFDDLYAILAEPRGE